MNTTEQHALEAQTALVTLAREIAADSIEVSFGDGTIFLTGNVRKDIDDAFFAIAKSYKAVTSRKVKVCRFNGKGSKIWRIDTGELRRGFRIVRTDAEQFELISGKWYGKQGR